MDRRLGPQLAGGEGHLVQQALEHGVQPPRADVLRALVGHLGDAGDLRHRVLGEGQLHALGGQQRGVLADERVLRLAQDAHQILAAQRLQLHADGEAALQLGDEIAGLGDVEGARGDEEHVVRLHLAVLGVDGGALDDGEDVALHALAGHVRALALAALAAGDLVDLVDEDDAAGLGADQRVARHPVVVHQLAGLLLLEQLERLGHAHLAALGAVHARHVLEEVLQVDAHLLHAVAGEVAQERGVAVGRLHLHVLVIERAGAQLGAQLLALGALPAGTGGGGGGRLRSRTAAARRRLGRAARTAAP